MTTDLRELRERYIQAGRVMLERRAEDPLFLWEPTDKQRPFVRSTLLSEAPENWFVAANRSGKSDAGAYVGASLARFGGEAKAAYGRDGVTVKDGATSGWVVSLDFEASRDIMQPKYFDNGRVPPGASHPPFIPDREIADRRMSDPVTLILKNGSIIVFKSAESGRLKFQGAEKDWVHFDEEPPKDIYEETIIRVPAGRKLRVFGTCTLLPPEGQVGGVTWVYNDIIRARRPSIGLFGASIRDNPHLLPEEIQRLEDRYPEGSLERRIRLEGEWLPGLSGSRAYVAFERSLHLKKQPWPPAARRPVCWWWDFNVEPMVSGIGQRDGRIFRVMRALILEEGNIGEMVELFKQALPRHHGEIWLYGDATGRGRTGQTGQSCYTLILNAMRTYGSPVRMRVPEENPHQTDRINAVNAALKDSRGEVRVEIDPLCDELVADLEGVLRDARGGLKKTSNRRDPYFRRGHISDALGYWIVYDEPVRPFHEGLRMLRPPPSPGYAWTRPESAPLPR